MNLPENVWDKIYNPSYPIKYSKCQKTITNSSYLQIELSKAQTQLPNQTNTYKNDQEKLAGVT